MKIATLLVVPCAITLLLGGVLLWPTAPTADSSPAQASQHAQSHPHDPEQEAADALQARYRTFVSAQSSLTVPTEISLASLQILFDEREQLRQQSFTPAEQAQLFAERMKFSAVMIFSVLWFTLSYIPMAHMVWGGGLLAEDGALDFAGGTVVHINAAVAGLVGAYMSFW